MNPRDGCRLPVSGNVGNGTTNSTTSPAVAQFLSLPQLGSSAAIGRRCEHQPPSHLSPSHTHALSFPLPPAPSAYHAHWMALPLRSSSLGAPNLRNPLLEEIPSTFFPSEIPRSRDILSQRAAFWESQMALDGMAARDGALAHRLLSSRLPTMTFFPQTLPRISTFGRDTLDMAVGVRERQSQPDKNSEVRTKRSQEEEALIFLGLTSRSQKKGMYFDASVLPDPDPVSITNRRTRGGVIEPFPERVHRMLTESQTHFEDVVGFCPHGRSFIIRKPDRFVRDILPNYFRQSHISSFLRQLNLYGFTRISSGTDEGSYYHELFLKGRPALCAYMRRVGVSSGQTSDPSGRCVKGPARGVTLADPDFYCMAPISHPKKASGDDEKETSQG